MAGKIKVINVKTESYNYNISIGNSILPIVSGIIDEKSPDKIVIIVSSNVYSLHKDYIDNAFDNIDNIEFFSVDDSEKNKNYKYAEKFLEQFIQKGISRKSIVISIGGGVIGDFAGYLSALYMRGVQIVHVPTTLLAMVDSSIGGKVAVNLSIGKNIVGAFHQPEAVISDTVFLETLPDVEFKNGLTEILKHGLIGEKRTFRILENNNPKTIKQEDIISELIYLSAKFKSSVVEKDTRESGLRAILNYGHTVGHAIESFMGYENITHGKGVAIGIKVENEISKGMGWLSDKEINRINSIINKYILTDNIAIDPDEILLHMKYDKKNFNGRLNFVLLKGLFNPVFNQQVDYDFLVKILNYSLLNKIG